MALYTNYGKHTDNFNTSYVILIFFVLYVINRIFNMTKSSKKQKITPTRSQTPVILPVNAQLKDVADSALRFLCISIVQYVIRFHLMEQPVIFKNIIRDNSLVVLGLGFFHLIVDKFFIRIVVEGSEEGYYTEMRHGNI